MDLNPTQLKFAPIEIIWQESNGRFCIVVFLKKKEKYFKDATFLIKKSKSHLVIGICILRFWNMPEAKIKPYAE